MSNAKKREAAVEQYLVRRVTALGGEIRKVRWIGRVGAPDRVIFWPEKVASDGIARRARTDWVELKKEGEKPRPSQVREHQRMMIAGQTIYVIDCVNGVEDYLRSICRV